MYFLWGGVYIFNPNNRGPIRSGPMQRLPLCSWAAYQRIPTTPALLQGVRGRSSARLIWLHQWNAKTKPQPSRRVVYVFALRFSPNS